MGGGGLAKNCIYIFFTCPCKVEQPHANKQWDDKFRNGNMLVELRCFVRELGICFH